MIEDRLKRKYLVMLALILVLALGLRTYKLTWGLPNEIHPYSYHPDETRLLQYLGNMHPEKLDFNPDDFAYPTFHLFIVGAILLLFSKLGFITLIPDPLFYATHPTEF
ncbi:MAG: hypothetical protein AABX52_01665, partial [Nanoarchaeota archaeon]